MLPYYKVRFNVMLVAFCTLSAMWGALAYRYYQLRNATPLTCEELEAQQETARVMEWKRAWAECMDDVDRYLDNVQETVCWDTLVDWQEQHDKETRRYEYLDEELQTCEDTLAVCRGERGMLTRELQERLIADLREE